MLMCGRTRCSEYGKCTVYFDCPMFKPTNVKPKKIEEKKGNKYHAEKCVCDGVEFDSRREANRYSELLLLSRSGAITGLKRQVKFELIPAQKDKDNKCIERACVYVADFTYYQDNKLIVEDVKGCKQGGAYAVFTIKRKLMLYKYGIKIKEI